MLFRIYQLNADTTKRRALTAPSSKGQVLIARAEGDNPAEALNANGKREASLLTEGGVYLVVPDPSINCDRFGQCLFTWTTPKVPTPPTQAVPYSI